MPNFHETALAHAAAMEDAPDETPAQLKARIKSLRVTLELVYENIRDYSNPTYEARKDYHKQETLDRAKRLIAEALKAK